MPELEHRGLLPRFYARQQALERDREIARIVLESGEAAPPAPSPGATLAGDERRLRGLPAIGRGVTGAIPGTHPERALTAKEARRRS